MININDIIISFKLSGCKMTNQRKALLEVLSENSGTLLSAYEILEKIKIKYPETNLSTIYRNLELLESLNIISKTILDGNSAHYELIYKDCHHHFICKGCGKIENLNYCPIEWIRENMKNRKFVITNHKLELYGYCEECLRENK